MKQYHYDIDNNNNPNRKKAAIEFKTYQRFITTIALPALFLILASMTVAPISPVQATVSSDNETAATPAPGGASLGPAGNGTNVTTTATAPSACLPQNATTTTGSPTAVDANATRTADNITATVAPSGASIDANDTSTSLATAGNTTTDNTTTATVAPSGASVC
jgi:hypothetical protein